MSELVLLSENESCATLTLNRPEKHNSLVPELTAALNQHLAALSKRSDLASVILNANGRSFSTGGDVKGFWEAEDRITYSRELVGALNEAILALMALPCPVLANVHGPITGGSLGLMLAADLVAISPKTFAQPYYSVVGFAPDGGWTAILPDRIGARQAGRILALNERLEAEQLIALGLADALCDDPAEQVRQWQSEMGRMVQGTLYAAKRLLYAERAETYRKALECERQAFIDRISLPEVSEGMRDFLALNS
ncbi:MAG: enoyl-CoA hydratase/isomerase family protein [Cohaesibacter sp.]|nr:enoyl-CoA hydratase/isomerase family protein [Cohaesibacter sp.]